MKLITEEMVSTSNTRYPKSDAEIAEYLNQQLEAKVQPLVDALKLIAKMLDEEGNYVAYKALKQWEAENG